MNSPKTWIMMDNDRQDTVHRLMEKSGLQQHLCEMLVQRGFLELSAVNQFFHGDLNNLHDPFKMKDMQIAVERLDQAINKKEKILVYGDFDVDGTTAVSLVYDFLHRIINHQGDISYYIPDRESEGCGVSEIGICYAKEGAYQLMICLDTGINDYETLRLASEWGIDVIICDHHLPAKELPPAYAILNPQRKDCLYPYKHLSGCGVGFKFLQAYCIFKQNLEPIRDLMPYLDLVAVSIAADIVPITGENRILAKYGLKRLNEAPREGLRQLLLKGMVKGEITVQTIVHIIGPRINAAGRMAHAGEVVALLIAQDPKEAAQKTEIIERFNEHRKAEDERITSEALEMIKKQIDEQKSSTVLFKNDWHQGVIGIVAARCIEKFYRPTIIMTGNNDQIVGSARSVNGFDVHKAISECSDLLVQYGGHKYAVGLTIDHENLSAFKEKFEEVVANQIIVEQTKPAIEVDLEINFSDISAGFANVIKQMSPFGPGNKPPLFTAKNIRAIDAPRIIKDRHIKFLAKQEGSEETFYIIGFNMFEYELFIASKMSFDMVFSIEVNDYYTPPSIELYAKDIDLG